MAPDCDIPELPDSAMKEVVNFFSPTFFLYKIEAMFTTVIFENMPSWIGKSPYLYPIELKTNSLRSKR